MANEHDKRFHSDRDIHKEGDELTLTHESGVKLDVVVIQDYRVAIGAKQKNQPDKAQLFDLREWSAA